MFFRPLTASTGSVGEACMEAESGRTQSSRPGHILPTPSLSLPKGGGALRGIEEKFAANPATGAATVSIPLPASPGRGGFGLQLSLLYNSGTGNGPFGLGWSLDL